MKDYRFFYYFYSPLNFYNYTFHFYFLHYIIHPKNSFMKTNIVFKGMLTTLALAVIMLSPSCTQEEDVEVLASNDPSLVGQQVSVPDPDGRFNAPVENHSVCGRTYVMNLFAGQTIKIGYVFISNNDEFLFVKYKTQLGWVLSETQLYVGALAGVPVNKSGNPKVGLFPYKTMHYPTVTTYEYAIPLDSLGSLNAVQSKIIVASHAVVMKLDNNKVVVQQETAWSGCIPFVKKGNWAIYSEFRIQECVEEPV